MLFFCFEQEDYSLLYFCNIVQEAQHKKPLKARMTVIIRENEGYEDTQWLPALCLQQSKSNKLKPIFANLLN